MSTADDVLRTRSWVEWMYSMICRQNVAHDEFMQVSPNEIVYGRTATSLVDEGFEKIQI